MKCFGLAAAGNILGRQAAGRFLGFMETSLHHLGVSDGIDFGVEVNRAKFRRYVATAHKQAGIRALKPLMITESRKFKLI